MKPSLVLTVLMGIYAFVGMAGAINEELSWNEFAEMLSELGEDEKYEFVRGHVLRGYKLSQQDINSQELDADLKLSLAIFNLVKKVSSNIETAKVLLQQNSEICFQPPVGCIDSGDAGVRPT